jgi:hypothetical protein
MARALYFNVVTDAFGNLLSGAQVAVYQPSTTTPVAYTLFADPSSAATVANPLTTDSRGYFAFYTASPQTFDLAVSAPGYNPATTPTQASAAPGRVIDGATLLAGTVGSTEIADGSLTDIDVAAANKDGVAATPSLRTLGSGAQQAAAGNHSHTATVSSVGLTMPAEFAVSGSPVTTAGTLAVSKASQSANQVYAGPASGAAAAPAFRALVPADLGGAWTTFSPGVSQPGALTVTVAFARYAIFGKLALVQLRVLITSAGTAANAIVVTGIPAAIAPLNTGGNVVCGSGIYYDSGTAYYLAAVMQFNATTLRLVTHNAVDYLGISGPNFAAASGDEVDLHASWELA